MKRFGSFILSLLFCVQILAGCADTAQQEQSEDRREPSDQVLQVENLSAYTNHQALVAYTDGAFEVLCFTDEADLEKGIIALLEDPSVLLIQPNYSYESTAITSDLLSGKQWALYNDGSFTMDESSNEFPVYDNPFGNPRTPGNWGAPDRDGFRQWANAGTSGSVTAVSGIDINITEAWNIYNGGSREVIVAIIDSGVDTSHEDFGDVFWVNEAEIAGNGVDDDGNGYIDDINGWNFYGNNNQIYVGNEDNHGTHVAGSIVATIDNGVGVSGIVSNGSVKLMILKALGGVSGSGSTASVVQAIQYAESQGATICNLSLGGTSYDSMLYRAMATSNMLFIVAAGNDEANLNTSAYYPASFNLDNIIVVANLQADGTLHDSSNYGSRNVHIAAPGTYILSTTTGDSYSYMSGTSMAAPIVTAVAAMLYSHSNSASLYEVRDAILRTATPLDSLSGLVFSEGMLNAGSALRYVEENYPVSDLPFTDLNPNDRSYSAVRHLYEENIMFGTSDSTFSPDELLTRAMTVTLLGRLVRVSTVDINTFTDVVNNSWYSGYVGWAVEDGIILGYGNGLFGTDDPVLAYQLDLMLSRLATQMGHSYSSGLTGKEPLTRGETAQALYAFSLWMNDIHS